MPGGQQINVGQGFVSVFAEALTGEESVTGQGDLTSRSVVSLRSRKLASIATASQALSGVQAGSVSGALGFTRTRAMTGQAFAVSQGSVTAPTPPSSSNITWEWNAPSLADERAFYDNIIRWARTASDETFDSRWSASGAGAGWGVGELHDNSEADDLWVWDQQTKRYGTALPATWRAAWLNWYTSAYVVRIDEEDPETGADGGVAGFGFDHMHGQGLAVAHHDGNPSALSALNALKSRITSLDEYQSVLSGGTEAYSYWEPRGPARQLIVACYAVQATNGTDAQWVTIRNTLLNGWVTSTDWQEGGVISEGGMYFASRDQAGFAEGTKTGYPNTFAGGQAAYDAGRRFNSTFQIGLLAEALWRAYVQTGRTDVRDKLIKMAKYCWVYAHRKGLNGAVWNFPNVGSRFGHEGTGAGATGTVQPLGGYYHGDAGDGTATNAGKNPAYDISLINLQVIGYKLTGEARFLDQAIQHYKRGIRFDNGSPFAQFNADGQVPSFLDTRCENSDARWFLYNKSALQYSYQLIENGGKPKIIGTEPTWYSTMNDQNARVFPNSAWMSSLGPAPGTLGVERDSVALFTYSGGFLNTVGIHDGATFRPGPWLGVHGGGHNSYNGNEIDCFGPLTSNTPGWVRTANANPAATNSNFSGNQPASSHTYSYLAHMAHTNKLLLPIVGARYSDGFGAVLSSWFDFTVASPNSNLTTAWKKAPTIPDMPNGSGDGYGTTACYDATRKRVIVTFGWGQTFTAIYDEVANTWTRFPAGSGSKAAISFTDRKVSAIDPVTQVVLVVQGDAPPVALDARTPQNDYYTPAGTNRPQGIGGLLFDPVYRRFVYYAGGNSMQICPVPANPYAGGDSWTWTTITFGGDTAPADSGATGVDIFNRFQFCPFPRGYVAVAHMTANVAFFKVV